MLKLMTIKILDINWRIPGLQNNFSIMQEDIILINWKDMLSLLKS